MNQLLNFNTNPAIQRPNVPLEQTEVDYLEKKAKNLCNVMNLELLSVHNQCVEVVNSQYPNAIYAQNCAVKADIFIKSPKEKVGINRAGDKILFRGLKLSVCKTIDRETEEISYSMRCSIDGAVFRYRSSEKEIINSVGSAFQYGPAITDLSFSKVIESLKVLLDFRSMTKSEIKKLWEKFGYKLIEKE